MLLCGVLWYALFCFHSQADSYTRHFLLWTAFWRHWCLFWCLLLVGGFVHSPVLPGEHFHHGCVDSDAQQHGRHAGEWALAREWSGPWQGLKHIWLGSHKLIRFSLHDPCMQPLSVVCNHSCLVQLRKRELCLIAYPQQQHVSYARERTNKQASERARDGLVTTILSVRQSVNQ